MIRGSPNPLCFVDAKKAYLEQFEYDHIQKVVNDANQGAVEIVQVKSSTKDYFAGLQAGADSKMKTYWYFIPLISMSLAFVLADGGVPLLLYQLCRVVGKCVNT